MIKENLRIIIADDSVVFAEALGLLLRNNKFNIIDVCYNGRELISSAKLNSAQLILADIEMPEMNGIEAARIVNYKYPHIPLIALSMHFEKVFLNEIIMVGFKGFLYKPETPQKLLEVIDQVLDNKFVFPNNLKMP